MNLFMDFSCVCVCMFFFPYAAAPFVIARLLSQLTNASIIGVRALLAFTPLFFFQFNFFYDYINLTKGKSKRKKKTQWLRN